MKQEYIKPDVTVFDMDVLQLIGGSEVVIGISTEEAVGEAF